MINMEKMYRGITNSPKTELVALIAETDTEIEVADSSVLLANEGIAVIGNGDVAETIKYTEVDGNILKGCIRGYEGSARSWTAGTRVARNFTAGDWNTAIDNIEGLYDRVDNDEVDPLTLQPGLQVVTAAKDARFKLGEIRGKTEINGQGRIGIIGVENPYAIGISRNLLPPFYEWTVIGLATGATYTIDEPYKMILNDPGQQPGEVSLFYAVISVPANTDITLRLPNDTWNTISDANGDILFYPWEKSKGQMINTGNNKQIRVYLGNRDGAGVYTFENPTLTIGFSESIPFQSQRKSMLAFQTDLHANPTDRTEPDVLFEQDGQYLKLAKWKKVVLDGSLSWNLMPSSDIGFKKVYTVIPGLTENVYVTKFDGTQLTRVIDAYTGGDQYFTSPGASILEISISNEDSGWGDDYDPSQEELGACFNGWKMYPYGDAAGAAAPYNGTGTRGWCYRVDGVTGNENSNFTGGTSTLPTTQAPNWSPYNLLCRLEKATVEPVTVEGCLTLAEGDNAVEVGTGIVLRESITPVFNSNSSLWSINAVVGSNYNYTKFKVNRYLAILKDSKSDFGWTETQRTTNNGSYVHKSKIDQSAAYSVTYTKLDKSPNVPITGALAVNEKTQLSDLTAGMAKVLHRVSVVEQNKAEKDIPGWIVPTLLNGWVGVSSSFYSAQYRKDSQNRVEIVGAVMSGTVGYAPVFVLPAGYRPGKRLEFPILTYDGTNYVLGGVEIKVTGEVQVFKGGNNFTFLDGIPLFTAEQ